MIADVKIVAGRFVTVYPMVEPKLDERTFAPDPRSPKVPRYADQDDPQPLYFLENELD